MRVDTDARAHDHVPEMKRAGIGGDDDRQAKRRALITSREIHATIGDPERVPTRPDGGARRADLTRGGTRPGVRLRRFAQRHTRQVRKDTHRRVHGDPRDVLFAVFTGELDRQRAVDAGGRRGHTRTESRRERQARGARTTRAIPVDVERARRVRIRSARDRFCAREPTQARRAPRRQIRTRHRCTASLRARERRTRTTIQLQLQFFERELRVFRKRRGELPRLRVRSDAPRDLDDHPVGRIVGFQEQPDQLAVARIGRFARRLAFPTTQRFCKEQLAMDRGAQQRRLSRGRGRDDDRRAVIDHHTTTRRSDHLALDRLTRVFAAERVFAAVRTGDRLTTAQPLIGERWAPAPRARLGVTAQHTADRRGAARRREVRRRYRDRRRRFGRDHVSDPIHLDRTATSVARRDLALHSLAFIRRDQHVVLAARADDRDTVAQPLIGEPRATVPHAI